MIETKAWEITLNNVDEPWHYQDIIVYAKTGDKAKAIAWKNNSGFIRDGQVPNENYSYDTFKYRDVEYTDLRVRRVKEFDKIEYNGQLVNKHQAEELKWIDERDTYAQYLVHNFPNETCVIWNESYSSFWGANRSGYSTSLIYAGLYSVQEALSIVKGSDYSRKESVRLCSTQDINNEIEKEVSKLQSEINRLNSYRR